MKDLLSNTGKSIQFTSSLQLAFAMRVNTTLKTFNNKSDPMEREGGVFTALNFYLYTYKKLYYIFVGK